MADRQPLVCAGIEAVLSREPDISVAGTFTNHTAVLGALRQDVQVAVVGHEPPYFDGVRVVRELRGRLVSVLLLEPSAAGEAVPAALRAGVRGILLKDQAPHLLPTAIRGVLRETMVIATLAMKHLYNAVAPLPDPRLSEEVRYLLSKREVEVLRQVARGLANREIADALSISVATVKSHLYSACRKLGLRDRTQAVVMAYQAGLMTSGQGLHPSEECP